MFDFARSKEKKVPHYLLLYEIPLDPSRGVAIPAPFRQLPAVAYRLRPMRITKRLTMPVGLTRDRLDIAVNNLGVVAIPAGWCNAPVAA